MLLITYASWQRADRTFPPTTPFVRIEPGPRGLTIVNEVAWRHDCPNGLSFYYRGLARVRRVFADGGRECRFVRFIAAPCPYGPRMHMDIDMVFGGGGGGAAGQGGTVPADDAVGMEWRGPCCVPLLGADDQGSEACVLRDSDSSSDDDDDDDDDAAAADDFAAAGAA